ncbi:MAG: hemolysin III family protein [Candidatus Coproplasma sp.]
MTDSICLKSNLNNVKKAQPVYGKGEEIFNAVSHIVGGGLGVIFAVIAFVIASFNPTANKFAAVAVYSFSVITLYTMSALYHFLPQGRAKRVFRIFDHCTIFLLIAGCYTPFCLLPLWGTTMGTVILVVEWGLAVLGITFNAVNMHWKAVKILSQISYVVMGWMIIPAIPLLLSTVSFPCFMWLLAGGIAYTVGIIFFALGKKKKYMHCVWHLFVLLGTIFQFISIVGLL